MTFCSCNTYSEITSGGLLSGGSAVDSVDQIGGGLLCGSSAVAWVTGTDQAFDGLAAVWSLQETSTGSADEFIDRAGSLHGTGGGGDTSFLSSVADGVFCLNSQSFANRDHISFPRDSISGAFSVSLWVRRDNAKFGETVFFSRGQVSSGHDYSFTIGTSYIGNLMARLQTSDGVFLAFSSEKLTEDRWYHVAASWDQTTLTVYIDGSEAGSVATTGDAMPYLTGNNAFAGRWNNGSGFTGNLQEIRLFHEAKGQDYLTAEHDNFCDANFVLHGSSIDEAIFE